ncbi:15479_t:CDS:2 [Acaulospora colombiana]|uniref:15479_t:CDS:1 n=1 Tax=Acaulospora colombiana TaxID=27376 RepID=A0ACA9N776_9GLOM|nr:15479_t:CDS:2 [Acaulospora colombiana]
MIVCTFIPVQGLGVAGGPWEFYRLLEQSQHPWNGEDDGRFGGRGLKLCTGRKIKGSIINDIWIQRSDNTAWVIDKNERRGGHPSTLAEQLADGSVRILVSLQYLDKIDRQYGEAENTPRPSLPSSSLIGFTRKRSHLRNSKLEILLSYMLPTFSQGIHAYYQGIKGKIRQFSAGL